MFTHLLVTTLQGWKVKAEPAEHIEEKLRQHVNMYTYIYMCVGVDMNITVHSIYISTLSSCIMEYRVMKYFHLG